jgi:hypothetical protein
LCIRNIVFSCRPTLTLDSLFFLFYCKGTGTQDRIQVFLQKWIILGLIKIIKCFWRALPLHCNASPTGTNCTNIPTKCTAIPTKCTAIPTKCTVSSTTCTTNPTNCNTSPTQYTAGLLSAPRLFYSTSSPPAKCTTSLTQCTISPTQNAPSVLPVHYQSCHVHHQSQQVQKR